MLRIIVTIGAIQAVAVIVNLIRSKIIAVSLGPEGVGVISVIDQVVQLVAQISAFSLPLAAVKFLSRSHSKGPEPFRRSYSSLLRILVLLTSAGTVLALSLVIWQPKLLDTKLSDYRAFLIPALLSIPAITLHGFFSSTLAAAQKPRVSAFLALMIAVSFAAAAYFGILVGGITGLYWSNLLASLLVVTVLLIYLQKKLDLPVLVEGHDIQRELRENPDTVTFSLILYGASFLYPLSYFMARYAVLTNFGEAEAGLLQAAIVLASALRLVLGPVNGLYLTPILNRHIPKAEKLQAALGYQRLLVVAIVTLAMPAVLFPQWLVTLLFSPSFVKISPFVFLFVIAFFISLLGGVFEALIIGLDDLKIYAVIAAFGHLSLGTVSWLLAPQYGILGVAIGFLVSSLSTFLLTLAQLSIRHGLTLPHRHSFSMVYGLLALTVAGIFFNLFEASQPVLILCKLGFFGLFVFSLFFLLSVEERHRIIRQVQPFLTYREGQPNWKHAVGRAYRWIETFLG